MYEITLFELTLREMTLFDYTLCAMSWCVLNYLCDFTCVTSLALRTVHVHVARWTLHVARGVGGGDT